MENIRYQRNVAPNNMLPQRGRHKRRLKMKGQTPARKDAITGHSSGNTT